MDVAGCFATLRVSKFSIMTDLDDRHQNYEYENLYVIYFVFCIYYTHFFSQILQRYFLIKEEYVSSSNCIIFKFYKILS